MLNLTHDQLRGEIIASKNVLTQLGFNVKTFVYPYSELNSTVIEYVKEAGYVCGRTLTPETYLLENSDPTAKYHIGSWSITNQSLDNFQQILSYARAKAQWKQLSLFKTSLNKWRIYKKTTLKSFCFQNSLQPTKNLHRDYPTS